MTCDTPSSQDAFTHQIWNSYVKEYRRYALNLMQFLETRSEVKFKVTVTQLWYATLRHPKMHPHTKFEIPTSKNIGYAPDTKVGRTDGRTVRLLYASQSSFVGIKMGFNYLFHGKIKKKNNQGGGPKLSQGRRVLILIPMETNSTCFSREGDAEPPPPSIHTLWI